MPRPLAIHLALAMIMAIGIFARTWEFGQLPPGMNPDEASSGVEALNLSRYGTDRYGMRFPVKFISWGSGQDGLYAYLLAPFVAVLGLSLTVVRLPMLGLGVLALPLFYIATRRMFGVRLALLATFMLAISPWHILLSRWALDANLLPFFFLAGFTCLLYVARSGWWFPAAALFFGLCLYAYGTAYAVIPVFMFCSLILMVRSKLINKWQMLAGLGVFGMLAVPIFLLLLVNGLELPSLSMGPFTVPRLPVAVRWETTTLLGAPDIWPALIANISTGVRLLIVESDGLLYNVAEPFGYFYRVGLVLALGGLILLVRGGQVGSRFEVRLLLAWLGAAALVAAMQPVNINRFNIIFMPLLILAALALDWVASLHRAVAPAIVVGLSAAFVAFSATYHGSEYRRQSSWKFQNGLLPALHFASEQTDQDLCVTDEINMAYIYALFTDQTSPAEFVSTVRYLDAAEPLRRVVSFGRYTFGMRHCPHEQGPSYVLRGDEIPPRLGNRYAYEFFDNFVVYYPVP